MEHTRIVALVPAHDEERALPAALASLRAQRVGPDRVVVVADGCTDGTAAVALAHGAEVLETVDNTDRKAGALNQALRVLLPTLDDADLLLVLDADSALSSDFLALARAHLDDPTVGAIGGIFHGRPDDAHGLLGELRPRALPGALQRNEYTRYAREIARRGGRARVLTGTATLFRVRTLRRIAAERGTALPGRPGDVYDSRALTEDNEITLAVRTLGLRAVSPAGCTVETEVMPTWRDLWHQRMRWQRGALENLRAYGFSRVTAPYWLQQVGMYLGILAVVLFLLATALFAALGELGPPRGVWLLVTAVFVVERIWTVRRRGWRGILLAAPIVVEFGYDLFQQAVYLAAATALAQGRTARWHHLSPAPI
ncbi:glycosyltransferase family 2 protein [Pseudonocardia oroxyli]|uniref:Glycosyltransferase, catalytic subunit of cellulose synthase and poly-beta-1,6-N-acetylglucosamine synthase n=1 Tax=Pseudonocardia oroxyli TaxID=366584 RepID=A0A1G7GSV8_PSEOR|nr:glycosyltransferase family 2 protein [Pseudonocardia oroxyli]SDE91230.1 Glycosyltransferase, catalytic subunit of cellulose synthase and poly-beta-1,6-N-acetylglucosamine synthase [Pseudonocardia oroxyli]